MTTSLETMIHRAIHTTLKKSGKVKAEHLIDLSEAVGSAVVLVFDMNTEDEGIADVSTETAETMAFSLETMKQERIAKAAHIQATAPAPDPRSVVSRTTEQPASKLLVLPGDPEFNDELKAPTGGVISALDFKRKKGPQKKQVEIQHWDPVDLIEVINKIAPEEVRWKATDGDGQEVVIMAKRNTLNQAVEKNVILTYKNPRASNTPSRDNVNDLTAKHFFSCFDEEIDVEAAMVDIMQQLKGLYRFRGERMEPSSGPEPPPLTIGSTRSAQMGDSYASDMVQPNQYQMIQDPLAHVRNQLKQQNVLLTPKDARS